MAKTSGRGPVKGAGDARQRADIETPSATGRGDDADRAAADRGDPVGEVRVQVCVECGREYMFEGETPADLACDRCGGTVFREFYADAQTDDVEEEFREATERDLATDAGGSDVRPGDLYDLNNP
ncbi:MAG: hypothetical protein ACRELD_05660 [Longimicrobiales bacterium]